MLADAHAHLFGYTGDELRAVIDECESAGVGMAINTAVSIETAHIVIHQCKLFPQNLKAAAGISPFDIVDAANGWDSELKDLLADPAVAAVGEIGLDGSNPQYPPLDAQMPFFVRQLELAIDADLPAVVHSRGVEKRAAEICRETGVRKAIFHCFTGDLDALEYIVDCGYYVSISGIITYKNSHLRELVRHVPIGNLLIETDSPYLSPVPHRGKPNKPPYLVHTARETAKLLGISDAELAGALNKNFEAAIKSNNKVK